MLLNKHQIAIAKDLKEEIVPMPEWGGDIKIRVLSVKEQLEFDNFMSKNQDSQDAAIYLIVKSCINEDGSLMFDDNEQDLELLRQKNASSILKLFKHIMDLNKQQPDDIEKLAKN